MREGSALRELALACASMGAVSAMRALVRGTDPMTKRLVVLVLLIATALLVACEQPTPPSSTPARISSPTPRPPSPTPTKPIYPACSDATPGTFVTCQIGRAYCSYRPDVNGRPTFCNDAPFPGHSFTLLVWGQNWSDFDGRCLLVTGPITTFEGKRQFEATSRSQVAFC